MPVIAKAGPDCGSCGAPLQVIVGGGDKFWYIKVSMIENGPFFIFQFIFNQGFKMEWLLNSEEIISN
jgi:hypothetical protein